MSVFLMMRSIAPTNRYGRICRQGNTQEGVIQTVRLGSTRRELCGPHALLVTGASDSHRDSLRLSKAPSLTRDWECVVLPCSAHPPAIHEEEKREGGGGCSVFSCLPQARECVRFCVCVSFALLAVQQGHNVAA